MKICCGDAKKGWHRQVAYEENMTPSGTADFELPCPACERQAKIDRLVERNKHLEDMVERHEDAAFEKDLKDE